jgi:hypothetical protein
LSGKVVGGCPCRPSLADPRQDHGYFDEAHLIHEFHAFAGVTPARFAAEQHALSDAFLW